MPRKAKLTPAPEPHIQSYETKADDPGHITMVEYGGLDAKAFNTLCGMLRYVDGDYKDPATFQALREQLGAAERPAYYLAIPPTLFGLVVEQLSGSGCASGARAGVA